MDLLKAYALSFLGVPYKWGGSNPIEGIDCSGFVQEILKSAGMDPPGDQTAQALYNHFESNSEWNKYALGSLAFYGESTTKITHVAFCLDQYRCIEAGGGGSTTLSKEDAAKQNAFVRIRPIKARKDLVAILKPRYAPIGVI
jgi:cell wall-associated NlpC family hydrolase